MHVAVCADREGGFEGDGGADRVLVPQGLTVDGAFGSAYDEAELELLRAVARQRLAAGQDELDLGLAGQRPAVVPARERLPRSASGAPLPITATRMWQLWDALEAVPCRATCTVVIHTRTCQTGDDDRMALLLRGKSQCHLCGLTIEDGQDVQMFPPGLFAPSSALAHLNDSAVHATCLSTQPEASEAVTALNGYLENFTYSSAAATAGPNARPTNPNRVDAQPAH